MPAYRSRSPRSLWPVAFHEAGHAVARTALGIRFRSVYIRSDGTGEARILSYSEAEADIIATLAGPYAEARYRRCASCFVLLFGGDQDWIAAQAMMKQLAPTHEAIAQALSSADIMGLKVDRRSADRRLGDDTNALFREHWSCIERVADALIQHRQLTPGAVAALAGLPEARSWAPASPKESSR